MTHHSLDRAAMRLYTPARERLYLNFVERQRFERAAAKTTPEIHAFCLTLLYSGCRISEALSLTADSV